MILLMCQVNSGENGILLGILHLTFCNSIYENTLTNLSKINEPFNTGKNVFMLVSWGVPHRGCEH
jgi:hypothetical protein